MDEPLVRLVKFTLLFCGDWLQRTKDIYSNKISVASFKISDDLWSEQEFRSVLSPCESRQRLRRNFQVRYVVKYGLSDLLVRLKSFLKKVQDNSLMSSAPLKVSNDRDRKGDTNTNCRYDDLIHNITS